MIESLRELLAYAAYIFACICAGGAIIKLIRPFRLVAEGVSPSMRLVSAYLFGMAILSVVWQAAGVFGCLNRLLVAVAMAAAVVLGARSAIGLCGGFGGQVASLRREIAAASWAWKVIAILVVAQILTLGLASLYPPRGDAAGYYLVVAKVFGQSGRVWPVAGFENFLQMGLVGEMNYSALFALGCSSAAKCLGWFNCLVIVASLLGIAASFGVGIVGRISLAAVALTSTTLAYVCEDGKVDTFAIALGLGAIFWASQYAGRRCAGVLAMAGLLAGMSIIAKASFAVTIVPMISMLVIWPAPGEGGRKFFSPGNLAPMIGSLAIMGLFVLLAMAPHFWKNWMLYNDPLAPFITTNPMWKSSMHTDYIFFAKGWQFYLSYPLIPFFGKYESQAGNISILLLAFAPLLAAGASRGAGGSTNRILVAGLISLAVYMAVLFVCFQPRHYILAMLAIAIPICAGIDRAYSSAGAIVRAMIVVVAAVLLLFMIKSESLMAGDGVKCAIGVKDSRQVVGDYAIACGKLNALASPNTKIVRALPYCYWLRSDLLANSCSSADISQLATLSPADRWRWLHDNGFRYVIYDKDSTLHRQKIASDNLVTIIDWGVAAKAELDTNACPPEIKVTPVISQSSLTVLEISGAD